MFQFEFDISKCANKELLDSCENFPKLKLQNACPLISDKNTILASLFYAFSLPLVCPFKKVSKRYMMQKIILSS